MRKKQGHTLKERFTYWFDNRMARGSLGFIRVLIIASILLAVIIALLIIAFGFHEDAEPAGVFWDSITTLINAWMPSYEDGSPGYLILMTVSAIAGVLFTSVLIGIITSAIEEKIIDMKKGDSPVLEEGHTIILGFREGEYSLLEQLILAAGDRRACVVVAEDMDRSEMEEAIRSNLDIPKRFRLICRTADIIDPVSIGKLSVETCRSVIIAPTDDTRTVKALLAVTARLHETGCEGVRVNAILTGNQFRLPAALAEKHNITALQTNETIAKIVAHSCTQRGISETFREVFNFDGSELFPVDLPGMESLSFRELSVRIEGATPVGIFRDGSALLAPPADTRLEPGDRLLVFAADADAARLLPAGAAPAEVPSFTVLSEDQTEAVILGCNETLPIILRELPENVTGVTLAGADYSPDDRAAIAAVANSRGLAVRYHTAGIRSDEELASLASDAAHIVILGDHKKDAETADMEAMFLLLSLRDIRAKEGTQFNITAEMRREQNQDLVLDEDHTDFVVASSMSSLFLAQLAENPELIGVFRELLSNEGAELFLKHIGDAEEGVRCTVREMRSALLDHGYVFLGYVNEEFESVFDPPLTAELSLTGADRLIVLGEK